MDFHQIWQGYLRDKWMQTKFGDNRRSGGFWGIGYVKYTNTIFVTLIFFPNRPGLCALRCIAACYSKSSVRLSVRDLDVPWAYVLG